MSTPLTDDQLLTWLTDGYLIIEPEQLDHADHRFFYQRASDLYDLSRATASPTTHLDHLGDNLRAQIPEIDRVLSDPAVDGALESLLGADYLTHPHSFCHRSSGRDQIFHQDGNLPWNERGHYRAHRPDWAMLFYYPQDVDDLNGPTEVVAGSQYWTIDHETDDGGWHPGDRIDRSIDEAALAADDLDARDRLLQEGLDRGLGVPGLERRFLHPRAGSVLIAHYDIVHRGSRTAGQRNDRFLYKFYFARVRSPIAPAQGRKALDLRAVRPSLRPVVASCWAWINGLPPQHDETDALSIPDRKALSDHLLNGTEEENVSAAYHLAHLATNARAGAVEVLEAGLCSDAESSRRASSHGLRQVGDVGLPALIRGARSERAPVRRASVAGLATEAAAESAAARDALITAVTSDPDDLVRSGAAYSLGQLGRAPTIDGNRLTRALLERLEPGAEPDNACNVGLRRSTVRQSAAYGLVQVLSNHRIDDDLVDRLIDGPLRDHDRYVQGLVAEALARTDHLSPTARRRLLRYLAGRRWNPTPDPHEAGGPTT